MSVLGGLQLRNQTPHRPRRAIAPTVHHLVFAGTVGVAMVAILSIALSAAADTPVSGNIVGQATWTAANSPYVVSGQLHVYDGGRITINAGVEVQFEAGAYLRIGTNNYYDDDGSLVVQGTAAEPVVFRAKNDGETWQGIRFESFEHGDAYGIMSHVRFEDMAAYGLYFYNSGPGTYENLTFDNAPAAGVYAYGTSAPTLRDAHFLGGSYGVNVDNSYSNPRIYDSVFENQSTRYARVGVQGAFSGNTYLGGGADFLDTGGTIQLLTDNREHPGTVTISGDGVPYDVTQPIHIIDNGLLRITAGTHIRFHPGAYVRIGEDSYYDDDGRLEAEGTTSDRIILEAVNATSTWGGVRFDSYESNDAWGTLRNVTLRDTTPFAIRFHKGGAGTYENLVIENPGGQGIHAQASSWPTIRSSTFIGGGYGVNVQDSYSNPRVYDSTFEGQTIRPARGGVQSVFLRNTYLDPGVTVQLVTNNREYAGTVRIHRDAVPYDMPEYMAMIDAGQLIIDPGTRIRFHAAAYIRIGEDHYADDDGSLIADALGQDPIILESWNTTWGGIRFHSYESNDAWGTLRNVVIRNASGQGLLFHKSSGGTYVNVTIEHPTHRGVYAQSSSWPTLINFTFIGGPYGVQTADSWSNPRIHTSTFRDQTTRFARVGIQTVFDDNTYEGTGDRIQLLTDSREYSATTVRVYRDGVPYEIDSPISMIDAASLVIEPGVHIRFHAAAYIRIGEDHYADDDGTLVADSIDDAPIVLESWNTTWGGIRFYSYETNDASGTVRNVIIRNVSGQGLFFHKSSAGIYEDVVIENATHRGVYLQASSAPTLRRFTFDGGPYGVQAADSWSNPRVYDSTFRDQTTRYARVGVYSIFTGNTYSGAGPTEAFVQLITDNREYAGTINWYADGTPFELAQSFAMIDAGVLAIHPGFHMRAAPGVSIRIGEDHYADDRGHIRATGTTEAPILLESWNASSTWGGVYVRGYAVGDATATLINTTIEGGSDDALDVYKGKVALDNVTLTNNVNAGLRLAASHWASAKSSTFRNSTWGIIASSGITVTDSVFDGNTEGAHLEYAGGTWSGNTFRNNGWGLHASNLDNGVTRHSRFEDNDVGIVMEPAATGNTFYDNLFRNVENVRGAVAGTVWSTVPANGTNICLGPTIAGNCWSTYVGVDLDGDGIGDTEVPFPVNGTHDPSPLVVTIDPWFTYDTLNATLGLIRFDDGTVDPMWPIVNWTWDFGDSTPDSHAPNPVHDFDIEGLFTVVLTVRDSAGHTATVNRTVLLDTLPPRTTGLLEGIPGQAGWWVSNVTVQLSAQDDSSTVDRILYRLGGAGDFLAYGEPFTITDEDLTILEYYAVDIAGNPSERKRVDIRIDVTDPESAVVFDGVLHESGWYSTNVSAVLSAADLISGVNLTHYRLNDGDIATYGGPVPIIGQGAYTLDVFAQDIAGNLEEATRHSLRIDVTPAESFIATVDGTRGARGWWQSDLTVTLDAVDIGSGVAGILHGLDGDALALYTDPVAITGDGTHTLVHHAVDIVGHAGALESLVYRVDTALPEATLEIEGDLHGSGWYRTPPTFWLNATDATSGIHLLEYRWDGGWKTFDGEAALTATGRHDLHTRITDAAGNVVELPPIEVAVDLAPPSTGLIVVDGAPGTSNWYRTNLTVRLAPTDGAGSGVLATAYAIDGAPDSAYTPGAELAITGEGPHVIRYASTDVVGHLESLRETAYRIDLTDPVTLVDVDAVQNTETGIYHEPVTITFTPTDGMSGVRTFQHRVNDGPWTSARSLHLDQPGTYSIRFTAGDHALRVEPEQVLNLTLDLDITPPVTTPSLDGARGTSHWYRTPVDVSLTAVDNEAGVDVIHYRLDDGAWTPYAGTFTVDAEGLHQVAFRAVDLVGNEESVKTLTVGLDLSDPVAGTTVTGEPGANGWFTGPATVQFSAADDVSPLVKKWYRVNGGSWRTFATHTFATSGVFNVEWLVVDAGGNEVTGARTIRVDVDRPVTTAEMTGGRVNDSAWWISAVKVTLDATDPTSGIVEVWYNVDGGAFVPYVGPFNVTGEGRHAISTYSVDGSGRPGLIVTTDILIDLTSPIVDLAIDLSLALDVGDRIIIGASLCVDVTGLDALSGLKDLTVRLVGEVQHLVTFNVEVGLHCFENLTDGEYNLGFGACNHAGLCDDGDFGKQIVVDTGGPVVTLLRPTPGSIMVQNVTAPVLRAVFGPPRVSVAPEVEGWPEDAPMSAADAGLDEGVTSANRTLARTTIVAGPRVPIWVNASDAAGVATVTFLLDGAPLAERQGSDRVNRSILVANVTERTPDSEDGWLNLSIERWNVTTYVVHIDTLGLAAGDHELTVVARDILGHETTRAFGFILDAGQQVGRATDAVAGILEGLDALPMAVPDGAHTGETDAAAAAVRGAIDNSAPARAQLGATLRYLALILDRWAAEDYVFVRDGVFEHYDLYGATDMPGLAVTDHGGGF